MAVDYLEAPAPEDLQLIRLLSQGLTHVEIARKLGKSDASIYQRSYRLRRAYACGTARQLVYVATKEGWIV